MLFSETGIVPGYPPTLWPRHRLDLYHGTTLRREQFIGLNEVN